MLSRLHGTRNRPPSHLPEVDVVAVRAPIVASGAGGTTELGARSIPTRALLSSCVVANDGRFVSTPPALVALVARSCGVGFPVDVCFGANDKTFFALVGEGIVVGMDEGTSTRCFDRGGVPDLATKKLSRVLWALSHFLSGWFIERMKKGERGLFVLFWIGGANGA